jgi:hypothetical protein
MIGGSTQRKLQMAGAMVSSLIPRDGLYQEGLPPETPWKYKARTLMRELALRLRLGCHGAYRGLVHGSGIFGVGRLYVTVFRTGGKIENLGLVSTKVVTTAGVNYLRDDFAAGAGSADISTFKYHECGTGTNAEAVGDTALQTPCTTVLNPDSTRAVGTQDNGTSKHYKSVGTLTFDGAAAVTEHGLFQATTTGTLWDRSQFSAINVASGDSIQFTYDLTLSDGG